MENILKAAVRLSNSSSMRVAAAASDQRRLGAAILSLSPDACDSAARAHPFRLLDGSDRAVLENPRAVLARARDTHDHDAATEGGVRSIIQRDFEKNHDVTATSRLTSQMPCSSRTRAFRGLVCHDRVHGAYARPAGT